MSLKKFSLLLMSGLFSIPAFSFDFDLNFPTELDFVKNRAAIQPASSGRVESGLYGMVRNNGTRFHEGIDIKSFRRNKKGRVEDKILSVASGTVAHVCRENNGSYGKYVVIEHFSGNVSFYTLYAHLDSVAPDLSKGLFVKNGHVLGIMGDTSSVYKFPEGTEHLHFEVGLRLGGNSFSEWYKSTFPADDKNLHSYWNGLNLAGLDPVEFFKVSGDPNVKTFEDWLKRQPVAFSVFVRTEEFPEILEFSPGLLKDLGMLVRERRNPLKGWYIDFSWSGVPLSFDRIYANAENVESLKIEKVNKKYLQLLKQRNIVSVNDKNEVFVGKRLKDILYIIFGHRF